MSTKRWGRGRLGRAAAVLTTALAVALGLLGPAGTAQAADAAGSELGSLTITSVNSGLNLDVRSGLTPGSGTVVTDSAPGGQQSWAARLRDDGSFGLAISGTGKCAEAGLPVRLRSCSGEAARRWYFQPVTGAEDTFLIRNTADHKCLDVLLASKLRGSWTQTYRCTGSKAQQWKLPAAASAAAYTAAVDYASTRCVKDADTCFWTEGTEAPAEYLPVQCVSPLWHNRTDKAVPYEFSLTTKSGWSSEVGIEVGGQIGTGSPNPFTAMVTGSLHLNVTESLEESLGNTVTMDVAPGHYAWVTLHELATKVTGEWTFDANGVPWTARDIVTVPLTSDDEGRASMYVAESGVEFGGCGR